jgi:NADH pyrophosphatase NudC (nudix superfamily)
MTIQEAYQYCLYCGSKAKLENNDRLVCAKCGKKYFFTPSIGAAGFCKNSKGEILVIERNAEPKKGTLGLPAGFVDINDDSLESALRREILEEIGLEITNIKYLSSHHTIYTHQGVDRPHMSTFFVCDIKEGELKIDENEVIKPIFVDLKTIDLERFGFDSTRMAIRDYLNIYKS